MNHLLLKVLISKCMVDKHELVDCIVTSPPYFNRRSYRGEPKTDGNITKWLYASQGKPIDGEIGNSNDKEKYIGDILEVLNDDKLKFHIHKYKFQQPSELMQF